MNTTTEQNTLSPAKSNKTYKVKYITKAGVIKYYEYPSKYVCKGRGKEIFKEISNNYIDVLKDDILSNSNKAYEIYKRLDNETKKNITIDKIRSFIYRWEYKNNCLEKI